MRNTSTTLERLAARLTHIEWTIYPTGAGDTFACGNPDGLVLRDGQMLDIQLGGRWVPGFIEAHPHTAAQFVAQADQNLCGLCPGMRVRLLDWMEGEHEAV